MGAEKFYIRSKVVSVFPCVIFKHTGLDLKRLCDLVPGVREIVSLWICVGGSAVMPGLLRRCFEDLETLIDASSESAGGTLSVGTCYCLFMKS